MSRILIVEDDVIICGGLKLFLEQKGFQVEVAYSCEEASLQLTSFDFDLMILDQNLPDENGLHFCRKLRKTKTLPIVFLTANDTDSDMVEGFKAGCDDYISKPFSVEILYQRIEAVLRRSVLAGSNNVFKYKNMTIDMERMQVTMNNEIVKLSATEYKILELLVKNKGKVMTREMILEKVWDYEENFVDENTLNVHIRRLRQKLEDDSKNPQYVQTVFGIGYTFGD